MQQKQPSRPAARRVRAAKSCTECRKRKQRCVFPRSSSSSLSQACNNCSKRYPAVECICEDAAQAGGSGVGKPVKYDTEIQLLASPAPPSLALIHRPAPSAAGPNLILDGRRTPDRGVEDSEPAVGCGILAMTPVVGVLNEISCCLSAPGIEASLRNIELFHFFLHHIAPNMSSIDGRSMPKLFREEMLPWMIQSPIMPHIALLMASTTQALEQEISSPTSITTSTSHAREALTLRTRVLSRINTFLQREAALHSTSAAAARALGEAIRSVINLTVAEWFWGDEDAMWAHFYGVRHMVAARGGLTGMGDPLCASVLVVTDFEIACYYERGLVLQADEGVMCGAPPPVFELPYSEFLASPLDASARSFRDWGRKMGLGREAVALLDDVRFLTRSVVVVAAAAAAAASGRKTGGEDGEPSVAGDEASSRAKIKATATWLYGRASAPPPPSQTRETPIDASAASLNESIRLAALIYSGSIMRSRPSSDFATTSPDVCEEFFAHMMAVGMTRWKSVPGIFVWVLLVMCPSARGSARRRYLRRKMAVAGMSVGHEDFALCMSYFRAFWMVQRWVVARTDGIEGGDGVGRASSLPAMDRSAVSAADRTQGGHEVGGEGEGVEGEVVEDRP